MQLNHKDIKLKMKDHATCTIMLLTIVFRERWIHHKKVQLRGSSHILWTLSAPTQGSILHTP